MRVSNFDFIAPSYDFLVRLVFGQRLWHAQKAHLSVISPQSSVLILGGGTGRILEWLPADLDITYLELSEKMIAKARKRGSANFIQADFTTFIPERTYDWVIAPFFLDCFTMHDLPAVIQKIRHCCHSSSQVIITDFQPHSALQRGLVKGMIWFFRRVANLPAQKIANIPPEMKQAFIRKRSRSFLNSLVFSDLYGLRNLRKDSSKGM